MKDGLIFFFTCYLCKAIVHFTNLDTMVVPNINFITSSLFDIYIEKNSLDLKTFHLFQPLRLNSIYLGKERQVWVFSYGWMQN